MEKVLISAQAQEALLRMLIKIGVLERNATSGRYTCETNCPVAYCSNEGLFNEEEALHALAAKLQLPLIAVNDKNRERFSLLLRHGLLQGIDMRRWERFRMIPVDVSPQQIVVAMANPLDHETRRALEFDIGLHVEVALGRESEILSVLGEIGQDAPEFDLDTIISAGTDQFSNGFDAQRAAEPNLDEGNVDAGPVVMLVNKIFFSALNAGASDIHISPESEGVAVRVRVDGVMQRLFVIPRQLKNPVISRMKLLAGMDIAERRKPQDGRLRIKTAVGTKDLRISTVPTIDGENLVARVLSSEIHTVSFEALGMPAELVARIDRALKSTSKVMLVSGPTGSGKTSTLYACLLSLCDGRSNIITVEDPIEYRIPGIMQIQVNPKIDMTFAQGLRSILRQDPDIVMVGEIRDEETAHIAMQVAQTGHLVLSTVHTNDAPSTVTRLMDLGLPPYIISSGLGCVLAQRLVRTVCQVCSRPAGDEAAAFCERHGISSEQMRQAAGCDQCAGSGYRGRSAVFSFLEIDDALRAIIREQRGEQALVEAARERGYQTLHDDALRLLESGTTTLDEVEFVLGPFPDPHSGHTSAQGDAGRAPSRSISKRRILIVEDDESLRTILTALLERELFEVEQACDGHAALEMVFSNPPELILSDVMMPKMDGIELVRRIKNDPRTADIPVLMLTAADDEKNEEVLINQGADDFVSKTASTKVMLARVHRLLARAVD